MKIYIQLLFLISSIFFLQTKGFCQTNQQFSLIELQQDFNVLRNRLEKSLANLYLYNSKIELTKTFDSLYSNLKPMTALEFYNYITPLCSKIKDGHSVILSDLKTRNSNYQYANYFPFDIFFNGEKLFIQKNLSGDLSIIEGTEILSINKINTTVLLKYLLERMVRDGDNENYPEWILNNYFNIYYGFSFGHPDKFEFELREVNGSTTSKTIDALPISTINQNRNARYAQHFSMKRSGDAIYLESIDSIKTSVLTIKSWDNSLLKNKYHQHFKKEIKNAMNEVLKKNPENIIIDLRNNQGGNAENGIYLLSYLMNQKFEYVKTVKKLICNTDTSQILKSITNSSFTQTGNPQKNIYSGKLYVLTNGGSFSNSGIFCSRIKFYNRGKIIGEETGGNSTVFSGQFGGSTILPNTKIACYNSNYQIVIADVKNNTGHGVIPDYKISPTIGDIISNNDVILNFTLALIKKKQNR